VPKTSSISLLVWRLAVQGRSPGGSALNQWQWPLPTRGAWRQGCVRLAVTENYGSCLVSSAWRWEYDCRAVFYQYPPSGV